MNDPNQTAVAVDLVEHMLALSPPNRLRLAADLIESGDPVYRGQAALLIDHVRNDLVLQALADDDRGPAS